MLLEAQQAAVAAAVVGTPCEEVDATARRIITEAGWGEQFIHRTGHGIGIEEHEDPYIVSGNGTPLEPGHAFSIEPGIYVAGPVRLPPRGHRGGGRRRARPAQPRRPRPRPAVADGRAALRRAGSGRRGGRSRRAPRGPPRARRGARGRGARRPPRRHVRPAPASAGQPAAHGLELVDPDGEVAAHDRSGAARPGDGERQPGSRATRLGDELVGQVGEGRVEPARRAGPPSRCAAGGGGAERPVSPTRRRAVGAAERTPGAMRSRRRTRCRTQRTARTQRGQQATTPAIRSPSRTASTAVTLPPSTPTRVPSATSWLGGSARSLGRP